MDPEVMSPTSREWSYSSNSALRRQRRYARQPPMHATPSSQLQSTPANFWSPRPANTRASCCWPAARTCTPKVSPSTSGRWQRELWSTETSTDGGRALNDETDVATRPHGSPSGRRAVITATPEQSPAIASLKSSGTPGSATSGALLVSAARGRVDARVELVEPDRTAERPARAWRHGLEEAQDGPERARHEDLVARALDRGGDRLGHLARLDHLPSARRARADGQVGLHDARVDGGHGDPARAQLGAHRVGEAARRVLARRVDREVRRRDP